MPDKQPTLRTKEGERTLLSALLLSAPGPAIISYAALVSGSAAQMADFLRRTSELVATFASFLIYRKLRKHPDEEGSCAKRLERLSSDTVAAAMCVSAIALIVVGIVRLLSEKPSAKTPLGLVIAALGLVVNVWFWRKYRAMNKDHPDAVVAAQQQLYRGKASIDLCIVAALAVVTIAPLSPLVRYADAFGSIAVAVYLLYSGINVCRKARANTV